MLFYFTKNTINGGGGGGGGVAFHNSRHRLALGHEVSVKSACFLFV